MFDRYIWQYKSVLWKSIVHWPERWPHPILITAVAFIIGLAAAVAIALGFCLTAFLLWLLNRALDCLDGAVARLSNRWTMIGGYLDFFFDICVFGSIALAFGVGHHVAWHIVAFLLCCLYINTASWMFLAALLIKKQGGGSTEGLKHPGLPSVPFEAGELTLAYSAAFVLPSYSPLIFCATGILLLISDIYRLYWAMRNVSSKLKT